MNIPVRVAKFNQAIRVKRTQSFHINKNKVEHKGIQMYLDTDTQLLNIDMDGRWLGVPTQGNIECLEFEAPSLDNPEWGVKEIGEFAIGQPSALERHLRKKKVKNG